jgi:hypothetical protein
LRRLPVGLLQVNAGEANDRVTLAEGSASDSSARFLLRHGVNSTTLAGEIDGSIAIDGRDGDDTLAISATAIIVDNFFARFGDGVNNDVHDGEVGDDFTVSPRTKMTW